MLERKSRNKKIIQNNFKKNQKKNEGMSTVKLKLFQTLQRNKYSLFLALHIPINKSVDSFFTKILNES